MSQSYWGPDYPDPNDYLVFLPGGHTALRVNWKAGPTSRSSRSASSAPDGQRRAARALYRQIQHSSTGQSRSIPLFQPSQAIVASKNLTNAVLNFTWLLDVRSIGSR